MPRPERAIDSGAGHVERFASDLRELRSRAGNPGYRKLAEIAGYSASTLAEAAAGRRLPALPVTLAYVHACGGDPTGWEERWRVVARGTAGERRDTGTGRPPYRGLEGYGPEDADRFFGRENVVARLAECLEPGRLVIVSGASGSGKSSVLRAGLVPVAARRGISTAIITPGESPVAALAAVDGESAGGLLVVDQLEEVFTLGHGHDGQTAFFDRLAAATARHSVVVGVRADFLTDCARFPPLAPALRGGTFIVGAMEPAELRRAVTGPARLAGLTVERALVTQILADAAGQPGALALISHALLETWRQRQAAVLTLAGYQAAGGVSGAIARTAERVYAELTPQHQSVARHVLVRLVALGEGTEDTRRRVQRSDLDSPGIDDVLGAFATARLLVVGEQTVELAHEAVIAAWPRLRGWLTDDRESLRTHRELLSAAAVWRSLGEDAGSLYRGARLSLVREWAARGDNRSMLAPAETAFLRASEVAEAADEAARERRARQQRRFTRALGALLAVVTILAGTAAWQWRTAVRQREQAVSRQRAVGAQSVADQDVAEALRLSLSGYETSPTVEARGALLSLAGWRSYAGRLGAGTLVRAVALSPDGSMLAAAETSGRITVWDVARRSARSVLTGHRKGVRAVAFSPDGHLLVSADAGGTAIVWDARQGIRLRTLTADAGRLNAAAFSPDGRSIATLSADGRIRLWGASGGGPIAQLGERGGEASDVAFTPDGRNLLSATSGGALVLWDVRSRSVVRTFGAEQPLRTVAVSPDGTLAAAGEGREVAVWNLRSGKRLATLRGHTGAVSSLAFVDATTLVSAGFDSLVRVWDAAHGAHICNLLGANSSLYAVATASGGRLIAAGGRDNSVLLWDRSQLPWSGHTGEVKALAVAGSGHLLVSAGTDSTARFWPLRGDAPSAGDPTHAPSAPASVPAPRAIIPRAGAVEDLAFAPGDRLIAAGEDDGTIRLRDPGRPAAGPRRLTGHTDQVQSVAFAPSGQVLVSAAADRTVRFWDVRAGTQLAAATQAAPLRRVAFSRDGRTLVSATIDGTVTMWDPTSRTPRATLRDETGLVDLALSPDGRLAAVGRSDGTIALWDLPSRALLARLDGHQGPVGALAFSPDGRMLASGSQDETVALWQVSSRKLWARLVGHRADVLCLAWSPDGRMLYSGSTDHTIIAWPVEPATARAQVQQALARDFPAAPKR